MPERRAPADAGPAPGTGDGAPADGADGAAPAGGDQLGTDVEPPPDKDTGPIQRLVLWNDWEVRPAAGAQLLEDASVVEALLEPDMATRQALTNDARDELVEACANLGYHLENIEVETEADGRVRAVLYLEPLLVVRRVEVEVSQSWFVTLYKEPLLRRMRLRQGERLEPPGDGRAKQLRDEVEHLRQFLQDEGFFEATVTIDVQKTKVYGAIIEVHAVLGPAYSVGRITIAHEDRLAISGAEIRAIFRHHKLDSDALGIHWLPKRFSLSQHKADIDRLTELYQKRGYPGVRVSTNYDPATSWDRTTRQVDFKVTIDERRRVDVAYEGNDPDRFPDDDLDKQLTFNAASIADDFEVEASATAIQRHYQKLGWFDAVVSWERERLRVDDGRRGERLIDRVKFRIDPGSRRELRRVDVVGADQVPEAVVRGALTVAAKKTTFSLLGGTTALTAEQLAGDVERILALYHARGFGATEVTASAAPAPEALGDAATTAALLASERAPRDLYVRFDIDEGPRTEVARIEVEFVGDHKASRDQVLAQLAVEPHTPYIVGNLERAGKRLGDWFWGIGRPRARITLAVTPADEPHQVVATYKIDEGGDVRIGKVVIRGNFNTDAWVIRRELRFREGALLTEALYTGGRSRLQATGLFSAVSIELLDFEEGRGDTVNVVVKVEERDDHRAYVDFELGRSSQKGTFFKINPVFPNPFGNGINGELSITRSFGFPDVLAAKYQSYEATARLPRWWTRRTIGFAADTELTAFWRRQETERFGFLTSWGGSVGVSRSWQRAGAPDRDARSIAATLHYDFRKFGRTEEAVRLAGNNGSLSTSPVDNRTGAIGLTLTLDQRVDARGNLSPLTPDHGYKLEGGVSFASRYLLGQDTFIKVHGGAQWIHQLTGRLQLRLDSRYDQGIPLGNAVLLPEVERFFAGGDDTVRGFDEDRLAIELVEQPVPPFDGLTQIKTLPAGGNIRLLGGVDTQVRLWQVKGINLASAVFVDAGSIVNTFSSFALDDIRPAVGIALIRALTPFGPLSLEYALPVFPREGDPTQGRWHFSVALRY
ncbi:MAG: BamA/TamA family outer membrane protein [Kofleriaceae bacterium]|nr:BamA/TamA family outer membrane protein [Kofleriaceae bacterium]